MILDTNGLSAMADGDAGLQPVLAEAAGIELPAIVLGEYRFGILRSRSHARYERWLDETVSVCRVLAVDDHTAREYAAVRDELKQKGRPIPGNDLWIAALARQYALPLLSRDRHFDFVRGVKRVGW